MRNVLLALPHLLQRPRLRQERPHLKHPRLLSASLCRTREKYGIEGGDVEDVVSVTFYLFVVLHPVLGLGDVVV